MRERATIVVIGADEPVGWAVAKVIREAGFSAEVFASAEHFIRSGQALHTACLVLDVQLPGMTGMQLQSHLASSGSHIPIIFISTSADERGRALALEMGAVNFRDKLSGDKALLKEVSSILKPAGKDTTNTAKGRNS